MKLPMRLSRGAFEMAVRETIEGDPALSHALLPMLQARQALFDTFLELDRRVRRAAKDDAIGSAQQGPADCEEKRDPRERPTADQLTELDPHARLEKRNSTRFPQPMGWTPPDGIEVPKWRC